MAHVRAGSIALISGRRADVCFTPDSDRTADIEAGPVGASSGHVVGGLIGQDKAGAVRAKGAELAFHFWGLTCAKH